MLFASFFAFSRRCPIERTLRRILPIQLGFNWFGREQCEVGKSFWSWDYIFIFDFIAKLMRIRVTLCACESKESILALETFVSVCEVFMLCTRSLNHKFHQKRHLKLLVLRNVRICSLRFVHRKLGVFIHWFLWKGWVGHNYTVFGDFIRIERHFSLPSIISISSQKYYDPPIRKSYVQMVQRKMQLNESSFCLFWMAKWKMSLRPIARTCTQCSHCKRSL